MAREHTSESGDAGGLVISAKTARQQSSRKFVSRDEIKDAVSHLPSIHPDDLPERLSRFEVSFSPASIRVSQTDPKRKGERSDNWQPRQPVMEWSDKSRSKMVERLATLDYSPFDIPNSLLAFITLTYPSDWLAVAPTASHAKTHLHSFRKRFERAFGRPFFAVWKMEFQRRGAPHFHLLAPVPSGVGFGDWLSHAWADIVNHPDPVQREKHLSAGTGIDRAKGINADTAQRISYYFSKHASANKGVKEYQNRPPAEWMEAGSVGRFWGYWGIEPSTETIIMSDEHALLVARILRRWQKANRKLVRVKVWRTNMRTGEIYQRSVRRRQRVVPASRAFRLVPDGEKFARMLARLLR